MRTADLKAKRKGSEVFVSAQLIGEKRALNKTLEFIPGSCLIGALLFYTGKRC